MRTTRRIGRGKMLNRTVEALAIMVLMMTMMIPLLEATTIVARESQQPKTTMTPLPTPTPTKEWSFATGDRVFPSPCVADVDGDGNQEVLVGSADNNIYCLSRTGSLEWNYTTGGDIYSSACVADVDGDNYQEVLVGSDNKKVYCLSRTGSLEWNYTTGGEVSSSPCVADVDADAQLEVLVGSLDKQVYCLNRTGNLEWNYTTTDYVTSSPCVADVDEDGQQEVLIGSYDNEVYCLNRTGGLEWSYTTEGDVYSSPCVADVDGDGQREVLVGSYGKVYCLNRTGGPEWTFTTGTQIEGSPCVADMDGDKQLEVLVALPNSKIYCLNRTGGPEWSYTAGGSIETSPCVADVDGDKQLEVLVGALDCKVHCVNRTGHLEWTYAAGSAVFYSPVVADVDGDKQLEVLVGSDDKRVYCLSVIGAPYDVSAYPWPSICFHGDIHHTGIFDDSDGDGLTNGYEAIVGTNPLIVDTDGDTALDYTEFLQSMDPFVDTVPPATVTDLRQGGTAASNWITLMWTAPGDNGWTGTAKGYIVKYSTEGPITSANWDSATEFVQSWAGYQWYGTVEGLASDTLYWFAIEAYDEIPNCGGVSDSVSAKTVDDVAPSAITDLTVISILGNNVTLSWTAPGDNGANGTATSYLVQYSKSGPINGSSSGSPMNYVQSWTPRSGGGAEVRTITGLNYSTTYWFAIRAIDEVSHTGGVSNSPSATTGSPPPTSGITTIITTISTHSHTTITTSGATSTAGAELMIAIAGILVGTTGIALAVVAIVRAKKRHR